MKSWIWRGMMVAALWSGWGAGAAAEPVVESLGTPIRSAELRSFFPVLEPDGRRYVVADVQDYGPTGYLLLTDFATGKTEQLSNPPGVVQDDSFGALLTGDRHYFYSQAAVVLSCDLNRRQWRVWGKLDPDTRYYFAMIEGEGDWLYLGGYPKCNLLALNRRSGEVRNFGRMDPEQYYILNLARDDQGWVYCGIGFARRNLVAFHPETGKRRDLLPEQARTNGRVDVYTGKDGAAYAVNDQQYYRLRGGKAEPVKERGERRPDYTGRYLAFDKNFADGTEVVLYDLENRDLAWRDGERKIRHQPLEFRSGGTQTIGNVMLPDGTIYLSGAHPMHLGKIDGKDGKMHDYGFVPAIGGGCFTVMAAAPNGLIYGGQYAGGRLWVFDPKQPWFLPGMSVPLWNRRDAVELAAAFRSRNGTCKRLLQPDVIYFHGERHELDFDAPQAGEYLIRLLLLKMPEYGEVAIDVDGREVRRIDCHLEQGLEYSPVIAIREKLTAGKHTLAMRGVGGSKVWGLAALDIAPLAPGAKSDTVLPPVNPRVIGQWAREMGQPRALEISPDGQFGYMTGLGAYGLSGGSLVRVKLADGAFQRFDVLPSGQSGASLLLDGARLLVGMTVRTQGGGKVTAVYPEVLELDAVNGRVLRRQSLPEGRSIGALRFWQGRLAALTDRALFLLHPTTLAIEGRIDLAPAGLLTLTRKPLLGGPEGPLWVLSTNGIWEVAGPEGQAVLRYRSPTKISGGIGVRGQWLYFVRAHEVARMKL